VSAFLLGGVANGRTDSLEAGKVAQTRPARKSSYPTCQRPRTNSSPPSRPRWLDQTLPDLPPVRRLSLFVASVQALMDVNELGHLSRARKAQTTQ
jgi:hypothetical protein